MKRRSKQLLSMLCVLTLLLGLLPLGAQASPVEEELSATEELPLGEDSAAAEVPQFPPEGPEEDAPTGVMPGLDVPAVDETDETADAPLGVLLAVQAEHTHNFNGGNLKSSFYTFAKEGKTPSTSDKNTKNGYSITTSDGQKLTINKALKMESTTTISFTAPEAGQLTIYCASTGSTSFKCGDKTYAVSSGKATIPTPQGSCIVSRGSGESHIVYLEWQSSGCAVHTWGTTYVPVKAPTCTEPGAEANQCTVCGATNPETRSVPALGHDFQNYTQDKAPTCADPGLETGGCSRCDATDTRSVPATGKHTYANGKCTVCGVQEGKTPCATHTMGAPVVKAATCTAPGESAQTCSVCGMTVTTPLPATGHAWGQWSVKTTGNCQTEGVEARTCANCREEETRSTGFGAHSFSGSTCTICGATAGIVAGGWFESLYAEIDGVSDSQVSAVSYTGPMSGTLQGEDLQYLVRDASLSSGKSGVRIDIPGLTPGTYNLEVQAGGKFVASNIRVLAHDRSGYAHFNYTQGVGAYRDDGVLKENAIVLYVTDANKDAVTLTAPDGTTVTGIGNILNTVGCQSKSGGKNNTNQNVLQKLADSDTPLVVRIIGKVTNPVGTTAYDSVDYGGSVGDNGNMARMKSAKNVTIEGIGSGAMIYGWGIHFIAAVNDPDAGRGQSFEVRNITFDEVPEDCVGMEGQYESGKFSPVQRCWIHNCSFYPAHISNPAESDKKDGDGSCDFKRGQYMTMSYNYFEGCHKTNLVGSGDSEAAGPQYHITWHHNHWVNCKARGPLSRRANIHIYNCWYENQTDYAMNPRVNTYIFSEYNTFLNCKQPRLVESGAIKSYHDALGSVITDDAKVKTVTDKTETVSSGNTYENFDTNASLSYIPDGNYLLDQSTLEARAKIVAYTGPMKAVKDALTPEEAYASTVAKERVPSGNVPLPYDKDITGDSGSDNIIFNGGSGTSSGYKFSKSTTGQNVVFTVGESVNITIAGTGINLINADSGNAVLKEPGTASGLPAGTYYVQPNNFQPGDQTGAGFSFKDGTLSHLTIQRASQPIHVHSYSTAGTVAQAATCSATGLMRYDCTGCDDYKLEIIPMTKHNYVGGFCVACGVADGTFNDGSGTGEVIAVQSVSVEPTALELEQGSRAQLTATVTPSNATARKVFWTTSNSAVATVSNTGMVMGQGAGTATITASAGGKSATSTVTVIGVSTKTYTFAAKDYSNYANDASLPAGTKLGTDGYFTTAGNNTWRTEAANKPQSLLTASQGASGLSFTVSAGATAQTVTMSVCSTGTNNYSSMALLDANGSLVAASDGKTVRAVKTKSGTTVTFKDLPAGTYTIVSPTVANASDVGLSDLTSSGNNVNSRGLRIINISVTEAKRSDGSASVPVTGVTLDKTAVSLEQGQNTKLTATVAPANATNKLVTWSTSNSAVASVNAGVVYAAGAGIATITASCGGKSATATVTVNSSSSSVVAVTGVTLDKTTAELKVGGTVTLTATVAPANATDKSVTWSTSNSAVASVSGGVVTARSAGAATITATAGGHSATCAVTATVDDIAEEHDFRWVVTKEPSCTEKGLESYQCSKCGTVQQVRDIPALVHAWSAWTTVKAVTCTVDGLQTRTCATCHATETDDIPAVGHDYGAWQTVRESTCQELGLRRHYCVVCNASEDEDIALAAHSWGDWTVTLDPTCTEDGQQSKVCSVGGERDTESVPALGHNFVNGKCERCQMSEDVDEHTHDWGAGWTATTPATCTTAGVETRTCSVTGCGAREARSVAALGHDFGAWTTSKPATCTEKGQEARKCSRCGETQTRDLAANGHSYDATGTCTVCGATQTTVVVPVTGVSLSRTSASVKVGGALTLTATVKPDNATVKTVKWTSSDETVATVSDSGVVTAVKAGKATITVTTLDGGKTATCALTVTAGGGSSSGGGSAKPATPTTPGTPSAGAAMPFIDVPPTAWFHNTVKRAFELGLMKGTDAVHFAPSATTTRAMVATVLFRLDGEKGDDVNTLFTDVASGQWYTQAIAWATGKGVVKGYDDTTFAPDDNVTREQLAVMLYRYAAPTEAAEKDLSAFTDAASVSSWAKDAMTWAVDKGIITGKGGDVLDPQGLATRAEICTVLVRYLDLAK